MFSCYHLSLAIQALVLSAPSARPNSKNLHCDSANSCFFCEDFLVLVLVLELELVGAGLPTCKGGFEAAALV
jgi:hypothetical protein